MPLAIRSKLSIRPSLVARVLLAAVLMATTTVALAQRVEGDRAQATGLYGAEVVVNGQGPGERNGAFARGLLQVLTRLTGDRGINQRPGVGDELRRAKDYVDKYDYRQDEGVSASGAPSFKTTLVIQYDAAKVNEIVSTLGLPTWPQPRPKPVLWLAIDDGTGAGPRLVGVGKSNAARPVLDRAVQRGYRLGLPAGNAAEQALVGAIWRGDSAAIARASAKYSPPIQLVGKMYRSAKGGWQVDWIFQDNGKVLSRWTSSDTDARRAMSAGADGAADALIRKYAKPGKPLSPPGDFTLTFVGVNSTDDFMRLAAYLERASVVKRATPIRATPDALVYEVQLSTGLAGFAKIAAKDGVIEPAGEGESATTYRLR
ncbi:DUF2066 domain-containing protein [Lysobacter humi (ex Lee et al. 2017)]